MRTAITSNRRRLIVASSIVVAAAAALVYRQKQAAAAPTLQRIDFSTAPFTHVGISDAACCDPLPAQSVYSGNWLIHVQQWGIIGVNVVTGVKTMISPVEGPGGCTGGGCHYGNACFQPPIQKMYFNDTFQSVVAVYASLKWVVSTGYKISDRFDGRHAEVLQVYSITDAKLAYVGDIKAPSNIIGPSPLVRLVGDSVWVSEGLYRPPVPNLWSRFDLNTRLLVEAAVPESLVPAFTPQHGVNGYTYKIWATGKIYPPYNMLCEYSAIRSDVAFATPTAAPVPPSPLVSATRTKTTVPSPAPCCDGKSYPCPLNVTKCPTTATRAPSTTRAPIFTLTAARTASAVPRTSTQSPMPSRSVTLKATSTHTAIPPVPSPSRTPTAIAIGPSGCKAKQ